MKPLTLNISKMKKISGDKDKSTFLHPEGHTITIAHSRLPHIQRKQIEKIPIDTEKLPHLYGGTDDAEPVNSSNYAPNYDVERQAAINMNNNIDQASVDFQNKLRADKGVPAIEDKTDNTQNADYKMGPDKTVIATDEDADKVKEFMQKSSGDEPDEEMGSNQGITPKSPLINNANNSMSNSAQNQSVQNNYQPPQKSLDEELAENAKNQQDIANRTKVADDNLKNLVSIEPNRLWHNMDTSQKVGTAIAMVLGGLGAGLTHGKNEAAEYFDNAINRDIESQKNDNSNKINLWKMHREGLGSEAAANLQTKNDLLLAAQVKLHEQMGELPGPMANQRALALNQKLEEERQLNKIKLDAFKNVNSSSSNPNGSSEEAYLNKLQNLQMIAPELHKDAQAKYIPGIGVAQLPVDEKMHESLQHLDALDNKLDKAINFAKKVGTTYPLTEHNQEANDLQNSIQLDIGKIHDLNRINEWEAKKYEKMIGNPGQIRSGTAIQSFKDLKDEIRMKRQATLNGLHVTPFSNSRISSTGESAPIKIGRDGKQYYQKGNYMIPVGQ